MSLPSALPPPRALPGTTVRDVSWEGVLDWILGRGLTVVLIVLGAVVLRWLLHRLINRTVAGLVKEKRARTEGQPTAADPEHTAQTPPPEESTPPSTDELPVVRRQARLAARALEGRFLNPERQRQRVETVGSVLRSIATIVILTIAVLMIGDTLGLNMAPVLASAGVGGVALGFGAQSLVKDFLSGIFMMAEDQYGVGDFIDTGTAAGTVEEVTLRVTRLRDAQGVIWYVRNGEIVHVANKSQGWSTAIVDVPVAYDEAPAPVIATLTEAMRELREAPEWDDVLMEQPRVVGVESVTGGTMSIRILAKCAPNEHWGAQREIRERALTACAKAGIRGPVIIPPLTGGHP